VTIEDIVVTAIETAVAAAGSGTPLYQAEVHDTVYLRITKGYGIRIGDCTSDLAPSPGDTQLEEFNAELMLVFYARIAGAEKSDRKAARNQVRELALATAKLFVDDPTIGGAVRDCNLGKLKRGYDSLTDADSYAVANLPLVVNQT
jgi:hypothetical protein